MFFVDEGPRPRQAVVRIHTATLEVGQYNKSMANEGSCLNGPSHSRLEPHERGGDSKTRKGRLYEAEVVPKDLAAQLHRESR